MDDTNIVAQLAAGFAMQRRAAAEDRAREAVRINFERDRLWGMSLKQKLAFRHEQLSAGVAPFALAGAGLPHADDAALSRHVGRHA